MDRPGWSRKKKLGMLKGVYIPVCLNIFSILLFLRFPQIIGHIGLVGILGLLLASYLITTLTTLSLSAVSSNGDVKSGGTYFLISRSLGPEFGGSIGLLFYLAQVLNASLNVVALIAVLDMTFVQTIPQSFWWTYLLQTAALLACTALSFAGSGILSRASNALLIILGAAVLSIPLSAMFRRPFEDPSLDLSFTGLSADTLRSNLWPHQAGEHYRGITMFRDMFGILFPATSGILAGASMSGDLKSPNKSIPKGTLGATLTTFAAYLLVVLSLAASTSHGSLLRDPVVIQDTSLYAPTVLAGELAVTFFSALMGIVRAAKLLQAIARDKLFPGLSVFGRGLKKRDDPAAAVVLTYLIAQLALFASLDRLASLISILYLLTFFTMNLACFLLKIGSAPNFRPGFKFFNWQSAAAGAVLSVAAMFIIQMAEAAIAICLLVFLFLLLHYFAPPKRWGDISQSLIYHQVRKYLLRLKPEHIKFWRPQIILLVNDPRHQTRLIQFCNSLKKGGLYILGHVIVTSDFDTGIEESKSQQHAWTRYISEFSRIKAFVQLNMGPSIAWGVRNLILSAGLGGMRPNMAVIGFYNMEELRQVNPSMRGPLTTPGFVRTVSAKDGKALRRRRVDASTRLLEGHLPTDVIRTEGLMSASDYLTILEDLAQRFRMNVAIGKGFQILEAPRSDGQNTKKYIDLWPVQMSAELTSEGKSILTTNFDTYTLILQLGCILHSVKAWKKVYRLRVLVFVEYEDEVEAERGRVKALLERLRIEAEVLVFWLASGELATYNTIVSGRAVDPTTESIVNDCLRGEAWWDELQTLRGRPKSVSASEELDTLANIVESTAGRPGVFNPHNEPEHYGERRRQGLAHLGQLPKRPTVSTLARLGVSMGIHTANLPLTVLDDSTAGQGDLTSDSESSDDAGGRSIDFNDDASAASEGRTHAHDFEPVRRPLLSSPGRRKSHHDVSLLREPAARNKIQVDRISLASGTSLLRSYGTMADDADAGEESAATSSYPVNMAAVSGALLKLDRPATPRRGLSRNNSRDLLTGGMHTPAPRRPEFSRQPSRFSSHVLPQTEVWEEADEEGAGGPVLGFAESSGAPSRGYYPIELWQAQLESKTAAEDGASRPHTMPPTPGEGPSDVAINIAGLMASVEDEDDSAPESESGSSEQQQNQGPSLSFNHLPSRAQYLILNELLRQTSSAAAVLLTTLPIPAEGTCRSEEASVRYLSDMEVLCSDLPPVLLVLSNNMTVTVSL